MKLNQLLNSYTDNEIVAVVRGSELTVGWHQPDHVEMVKASKATSSLMAATANGLLQRGAWLEDMPKHVDVPKKLNGKLRDLIYEHYGMESEESKDRDELVPETPEELVPLIARYRAIVPEPKIDFSETGYLEVCSVVASWVTSVTPLLDDEDNQIDWAKLTLDQRLQVIRALPQESLMGIITKSFEQDSLDADVKND